MSRSRDRKSTDGLLSRIEARPWKDGKTISYRYKPLPTKDTPKPKPIPLGTDKWAANRKVLDLHGEGDGFGTLQWVWEKFTDPDHPAPRWKKLAQGSRDDYALAWKQVAKTFGRTMASMIDPPMIARYVNVERAKSPRRAVIEKSLMSNLFRHGITLGVCTSNPTTGVEVPESEPRTEAPAAELLARFLAWLDQQTPQRRIIGMAAEFASLAGSRKAEFLDIVRPQVDREAGEIRVKRAKQRGKKRGEVVDVISITPRLSALIDRIYALNRDCLYLFPTRSDNAYTARGFKTLWQRSVKAAMVAKVLTPESRFTFHDLRAYYVTVHKQAHDTLPDIHKNPATTARVYDRNTEVKRRAL